MNAPEFKGLIGAACGHEKRVLRRLDFHLHTDEHDSLERLLLTISAHPDSSIDNVRLSEIASLTRESLMQALSVFDKSCGSNESINESDLLSAAKYIHNLLHRLDLNATMKRQRHFSIDDSEPAKFGIEQTRSFRNCIIVDQLEQDYDFGIKPTVNGANASLLYLPSSLSAPVAHSIFTGVRAVCAEGATLSGAAYLSSITLPYSIVTECEVGFSRQRRVPIFEGASHEGRMTVFRPLTVANANNYRPRTLDAISHLGFTQSH
jgi:hypothetical protein